MKPTLGRIVHVVVRNTLGEQRAVAGIITVPAASSEFSVLTNGLDQVPALAVTVFPRPDTPGVEVPLWLPAEPQVRDRRGFYWCWPPRDGA